MYIEINFWCINIIKSAFYMNYNNITRANILKYKIYILLLTLTITYIYIYIYNELFELIDISTLMAKV